MGLDINVDPYIEEANGGTYAIAIIFEHEIVPAMNSSSAPMEKR